MGCMLCFHGSTWQHVAAYVSTWEHVATHSSACHGACAGLTAAPPSRRGPVRPQAETRHPHRPAAAPTMGQRGTRLRPRPSRAPQRGATPRTHTGSRCLAEGSSLCPGGTSWSLRISTYSPTSSTAPSMIPTALRCVLHAPRGHCNGACSRPIHPDCGSVKTPLASRWSRPTATAATPVA